MKKIFSPKFNNNSKRLLVFHLVMVLIIVSLPILSFSFLKQPTQAEARQNYINSSWYNYKQKPYGSGTYDSPYYIENGYELAYLIDIKTPSYAKLVTDIDLSAYYWLPIGYNFESYVQLDGQGNTIEGLNVQMSSAFDADSCAGLFGKLYGRGPTNLVVKGTVNCENMSAGGIVGCINNNGVVATTSNCRSYVNVTSKYIAGGIVGQTTGTGVININDCYNFGNVKVSMASDAIESMSGGIVGESNATTQLNYCYNGGNVQCYATNSNVTQYVHCGGIVGRATETTITYCTNGGKVDAGGSSSSKQAQEAYIGGLAGLYKDEHDHSASAILRISNCSNNGAINGNHVKEYACGSLKKCLCYVGGLLGYTHSTYISNCYSSTQVTGAGLGCETKSLVGLYAWVTRAYANSDRFYYEYNRSYSITNNFYGYCSGDILYQNGKNYCLINSSNKDEYNAFEFTVYANTQKTNGKELFSEIITASISNGNISYNAPSTKKSFTDFSEFLNSYHSTKGAYISSFQSLPENSFVGMISYKETWAVVTVVTYPEEELSTVSYYTHDDGNKFYVIPYFALTGKNWKRDIYCNSDVEIGKGFYEISDTGKSSSNTSTPAMAINYTSMPKAVDGFLESETTVEMQSAYNLKTTLSLGDEWDNDSNVNNGYPFLKEFYWVYSA